MNLALWTFPGECVDASPGRSRDRVVAVISQFLNHLRPQDAGAANHDDLHGFPSQKIVAVMQHLHGVSLIRV